RMPGPEPQPSITPSRSAATDWTAGPAKWAAVAVLGLSSIFGMAWSILHTTAPTPAAPAPKPIAAPLLSPVQPEPTADSAPPAPKPPAPPTIARRVNINTATAPQLELLPGIGPRLAERIIDDRTAHGPFKRIDDLDRVKGIGPQTLQKLRPLITVD